MSLKSRIEKELKEAFSSLMPGADPVLRPSKVADFQANGVFSLAKALKRSPQEVASEVVGRLEGNELFRAEASGPGFINIYVSDDAIARAVEELVRAEEPVPTAPRSLRIVIDYSSPNVAKEMHVGHLRSTIIGDCLARMAEIVGHTVIRRNHIGDWGTPFGMLIEYLIDQGEEALGELEAGELDAFYKAARQRFDESEEFRQRARARVVALQQGDEQTRRYWRQLVEASTKYFQRIYELLDVTLSPEDVVGESFYQPLLEAVVNELLEKGIAVIDQGAVCYFPARDESPLIIRKSDGGYTYAATDLAAIKHRIGELSADAIWYVVGAPQAQHLRLVFEVAHKAGWVPDGVSLVHVAFGSVLGPDGKMLRSRSGEPIKLMDLLEEGLKRARAEVEKRANPLVDVEQTARQVAVAAIKYADLSTEREQDYVFEWERMLSFEGNTGPYLQYAHARIASIFRKAGNVTPSGSQVKLTSPIERELALRIAGYPDAFADALESLRPNQLCSYLYELAGCFASFYESCPVLHEQDSSIRASRFVLLSALRQVLQGGLFALGIAAPEAM